MSKAPKSTNGRPNDNRARTPREKFAALEAARQTAGVMVEVVCGMAGVSPATWRRCRRGESEPRPSTLRKLKRALDRLLAETIDPEDA